MNNKGTYCSARVTEACFVNALHKPLQGVSLARSWLVSQFWRQILSPFSQTPLFPKAPFSDI